MRKFLPLSALALGMVALLSGVPASAQEGLKGKTYHFGVNEARTSVSFVSEADIETIHGTGNKLAGSITVDASGKQASGTVRVGVRTLTTGIPLRDDHMRAAQWLDAAKYPWITLKIDSATEDAKNPKQWTYKGTLTIKGKSKAVTGKARVTAIPAKLGAQLGQGDWVHVKFGFQVDITQFGVQIPSTVVAKVSKVWDIKLDVFASTARPKARS